MSNKWLKQLRAYDDTVNPEYDSYAPENCLYTPSPYFNWIFANKSSGMPKNSSVLFFSEQKAGKSLSIYALVLEMQRRDPDGIAIIFNTELRGQLQGGIFPEIDQERMIIYDTNSAKEIFDRVENDIKSMVQDGLPLKIIAIDSITNIMGIKRENAESATDHLIGDHALTIQIGLSKLIPFCKRNKILLIGTEQMRDKVDASKYESKTKAASTWFTKHSFEYFISLKRAGAAEDKMDIEGKTFEDNIKDARDNKLLTGHKIYVKMEASSLGPQGRSGVFTMDYEKGIINQHEEIFFLGKDTGVLKTTNNRTFEFEGQKFNGKKECALAIRDNPELAKAILDQVRKLDE
jgi:RecA/RadA recombinase